MVNNELRKDYLLNRWVVIAKERKKRPTDFVTMRHNQKEGVCPLCPGNEHMTPPSVLTYLSINGEIKKEKDQKDLRHKNWLVRVVPNLFPAFSPPTKEQIYTPESTLFKNAIGHHEVVIESPCHDEHPSTVRVSQFVHVINTYLDRLNFLSKKSYVKHVAIFRNKGREAGASLSHAHTQMIALSQIPTLVEEEIKASIDHWKRNHECIYCNILEKETQSQRLIWQNNSYIVFSPWASINPLEFWVLPKRHQSNLLFLSKYEIKDLAETIRVCFGGLRKLLNNPPYNFGFHTTLTKDAQNYYHWHLEVYPRLAIWAGFEKSTGMFINTISPEDAALALRSAVKAELKAIS